MKNRIPSGLMCVLLKIRLFLVLMALVCLMGCASKSAITKEPAVSASTYVQKEKIGPSFSVYPANNDLGQVEFANQVEENIISIGGKVYERTARVRTVPPTPPFRMASGKKIPTDNNSSGETESDDETFTPMGFAPAVKAALAVGKEVYSLFFKADKGGAGMAAGIEKQAISHEISGNPSDYAIITYSSNRNDPNEGRVRIINKTNGEVIANFRLDKTNNGVKSYQMLFSDIFRVKYVSGDVK